MVQGTTSFAGKSVLAAGLCRLFRRRGLRVAPFKAQNISLNSGATLDGREMARAQIVQAEAAGLPPDTDMNPALLKPSGASGCQVVLQGRVWGNLPAAGMARYLEEAWVAISDSFERLARRFDVVVIEGAGSPAEINYQERDLANMRVARMADAPVLLTADLDRGGAFAALYGTWALQPGPDRERIRGFVFNRLRGSPEDLMPGVTRLGQETGVPTLGFLPYLDDLRLEEEDGVALEGRRRRLAVTGRVRVAVVQFPTISNFTDFAPLERDPAFCVTYATTAESLEDADIIILPGSKQTAADLAWLRRNGLEEVIRRRRERGSLLVGICGGYQMLGRRVADPDGVEGGAQEMEGLGHLDVDTRMGPVKTVWPVTAVVLDGTPLSGLGILPGYEIHMGITRIGPGSKPLLRVRRPRGEEVLDGAVSSDDRVWGTSLHGLFEHPGLRARLAGVPAEPGTPGAPGTPEMDDTLHWRNAQYDRLADMLEVHLDVSRILGLVGVE
jgi:adenosylcobyric acid synthase